MMMIVRYNFIKIILLTIYFTFSGISVEFEQTQYTVVEGAGSVEICLLSDGQNNVSVVVDVQPQETVPQSAAGKVYSTYGVMTYTNFIKE